MAKFSIEYKRTVRLAPYETLTIGMMQEFNTWETDFLPASQEIQDRVNGWLDEERERLAPGE